MVGDQRQGWAVLGAMTVLFVVCTCVLMGAEQQPTRACRR
jgi:K+-transporting ATPase ATPase A chain